jgi:type VI secretion system protein VasD
MTDIDAWRLRAGTSAGKLAACRDMGPKWFRFALLAVLSGGCPHQLPAPPTPSPPCPDPEPLRLLLTASDRLNPGERGEPLATVVRIYQLKGASKITGAGFEEMLDRDKDTLGEELVSAKELTLNPADRVDPALTRGEGVNYVAVVALFRQPGGTFWRAIYRLPALDPSHCRPPPRGRKRRPPRVFEAFFDENRVEIR